MGDTRSGGGTGARATTAARPGLLRRLGQAAGRAVNRVRGLFSRRQQLDSTTKRENPVAGVLSFFLIQVN